MTVESLFVRRGLTLIGVIAALMIGFAAIQAARAWTVEAAPLDTTPVSATAVEDALAVEQARSTDLQLQLQSLAANADRLTVALQAAQERIGADGDEATALRQDLKDAKAKLAKLKQSIRHATTATVVTTTRTTTTAAPSREREREREGGGDDHEPGDD